MSTQQPTPKKPKHRGKRRTNGEGTITKRRDGRYEARTPEYHRRDGTWGRKSVYGHSAKEVLEKLTEARVQLRLGSTFEAERTTLGEYIETWLGNAAVFRKASTVRAYRYSLANAESIKRMTMASIKRDTILGLYAKLLREGASPAGVAKLHTHLFMVFKTAVFDDHLQNDPMRKIKAPSVTAKEIEVWDGSELFTFLAALPVESTTYAMFYVAAFTGLRRGELLGLHWSDLDVRDDGTGALHVRRNVVPSSGRAYEVTTPKTKKSRRIVIITADVVEVLWAQKRRVNTERQLLGSAWTDTDAVFPSEVGTYRDPRNTSRHFSQWVKRAGVKRISLHAVRHTHASLLILHGHDARTVSERLGHSSVAFTLDRYQKLFDSQRRAAAFGMPDLLQGGTVARPSTLPLPDTFSLLEHAEPVGF
jgi:integrase